MQQAIFFHKIINFLSIAIAIFALIAGVLKREKLAWHATPLFIGFISLNFFSAICILSMGGFKDSMFFIALGANFLILFGEIWKKKFKKDSKSFFLVYLILLCSVAVFIK